MDFGLLFNEIKDTLRHGADPEALRRIRTTFDDPVFLAAWRDYLRRTNDYEERDQRNAELLEIMRLCGDGGADRNNELTNTRYGIGIGGSMVASSIIGLATAGVAAFFVMPLLGGALIAGACMSQTGRLSREERLYKDIEARVSKILEKADANE